MGHGTWITCKQHLFNVHGGVIRQGAHELQLDFFQLGLVGGLLRQRGGHVVRDLVDQRSQGGHHLVCNHHM